MAILKVLLSDLLTMEVVTVLEVMPAVVPDQMFTRSKAIPMKTAAKAQVQALFLCAKP